MAQVRIEPGGFLIRVGPGETLMQAALRSGYRWPTLCGGHASCTTCFVRLGEWTVAPAPPSGDEMAALAPIYARFPTADRDRLRLACRLTGGDEGEWCVTKAGVRPLEHQQEDEAVPDDAMKIVSEFFAGLGRSGRILETFDAYIAEDCVWENSGLPPAKGKEAVTALIRQMVDGLEVDTLEVEMRAAAADGDLVLTERVDHLVDKEGNRKLSMALAGVLRVRDGRIVLWRDYFDPAVLRPR